MRLTIKGRPITKKNSQRIVNHGGRPIPLQSKQYIDYERAALLQLRRCRPPQPINTPVNVRCTYYMPEDRVVDLLNLEAATLDILVKAGILEDDNTRVAWSHDGSRRYLDPENPRVEIEITEAKMELIKICGRCLRDGADTDGMQMVSRRKDEKSTCDLCGCRRYCVTFERGTGE